MTTTELITLLENQLSGWNRDGPRGILTYLNQVQNLLLSIPTDTMLIYDESTGKLPSIDTVVGTFTYNFPNNVYFVDGVLLEHGEESTLLGSRYLYDYGVETREARRPFEEMDISGIKYRYVPYVRTYRPTENDVAKVTFTRDPGDSTGVYKYKGYRKPTQLVSESVGLSVPPPCDMKYLYPATLMMIKSVENGNYETFYAYFEREIKPKYQQDLNVGDFGVNPFPVSRGF